MDKLLDRGVIAQYYTDLPLEYNNTNVVSPFRLRIIMEGIRQGNIDITKLSTEIKNQIYINNPHMAKRYGIKSNYGDNPNKIIITVYNKLRQ